MRRSDAPPFPLIDTSRRFPALAIRIESPIVREVRCVLLGAAALALLAACGSTQKADPRERMITPTADMSEREGQIIIMNYADFFVGRISEKVETLKVGVEDPVARKKLNLGRLRYAQAAYDIAAGPNPGINVIDMIVLVTLFRMKADETREEEYEPLIDELRAPLRDLETKIWRIAERVLSKEQRDELGALIDQWYEDHPDVRYVDTIRFEDWAAGRGVKQAVRKRSSLLFNAVGDISEQVDQAMLAADRLTYLLQRMPTLARWQAELVYNEVAASPTAQRVLAHTETVSSAVDRVSTTIDGLPDRIDEMRRDTLREAGNIRDETIRQLDASLAKYQEQFWRDLDERSEMIKSVSADVRATMSEADKLTQSIDKVVVSTQTLTIEARETLKELQKLQEAFSAGDEPETSAKEPLTLDDYLTVIKEATTTVKELNALVSSANELLGSPELDKRMGDVDKRVNNVFRRIMELVVIFIVGLFGSLAGYRVALARLGARRERKSS